MGIPVCRTLILAAAVVAGSALSGCSTTYDSAGNSYLSVWPFIGSRNPDLQLNQLLPYVITDPPENQECSWNQHSHPKFEKFKPLDVTPGPSCPS